MEWVLVFWLLNGEVAELPATEQQCYGVLDAARKHGSVSFTLSDKRRVNHLPAWRVSCVEIGDRNEQQAAR